MCLGYFMPLEQYKVFLFYRPFDHLYEMVANPLFLIKITNQSSQIQTAQLLERVND
mgnify:CR=1 FL=1|jgi:hypothetical protein